MAHKTDWEEGGSAGILCGNKAAQAIDAADGWVKCSVCGKKIRLIWEVRVEEAQ
jgi:hypothetical protein